MSEWFGDVNCCQWSWENNKQNIVRIEYESFEADERGGKNPTNANTGNQKNVNNSKILFDSFKFQPLKVIQKNMEIER